MHPDGHQVRTIRMISGSLEDGAELAAIEVTPPKPNVEMEPRLTFYPAIGEQATLTAKANNRLNRVELGWLLDYIRDEVGICLEVMRLLRPAL